MSIVLTDLTKRFGRNLVVNKVSLEVTDGHLFVLLGGSGSGKSTILRMIAGLIQPDGGTILLNGQDVTLLPPQARGIGFVFQNYSIFRHMTAAENIEFGLRIRRTPTPKRRERSEELLDLVGLAGLGRRFPDQLSGGQQQRVALARALAYQPAVLLLDEPFGALDVKIRAQLRKTLKDIQRRLMVTTILVTHDQEEAFELADQIGVIERGSLIEVGKTEDLYHRPRTEFVADFIGGSNVLTGRVRDNQVKVGSTVLPLPRGIGSHDEERPVRLLFRPETVLLQSEPFSTDSGVIALGQGQVIERVFAGSQQRIRLEVEGLQEIPSRVPQSDYGWRTTQIEAVRPSEAEPLVQFTPEQKFWIGLRHYHILETVGLKMLICSEDSSAGEAVANFGCYLAQAAGGSATMVSVVDSSQALVNARERLERLREQWLGQLPHLGIRVRQGAAGGEILLEVQEGHYELVILGRQKSSKEARPAAFGSTVRPLLEQVGVPVLMVQEPRSSLGRVLICSAVGEPGKADVRIGGRLASLTGGLATVLHVRSSQETSEQRRRAEQHLRQALSTLESMGVKSQSKIGEEPAIDHILSEAEEGDYDLIVIGAPAPRPPRRLRWHDLANQIVSGTHRPVLVVPLVD
jgi:sulfate transport system ATP-binding protein